jgi:hypothetical protein
LIAHDALIMAVDGARMSLFRNSGTGRAPKLELLTKEELKAPSIAEIGDDRPGRAFQSCGPTRGTYETPDLHQFFALVAAILSLIFVNRSYSASVIRALGRKNKALLYVLSSLVIISLVILFVPMIATLLKFSPLDGADVVMAFVGSAAVLLFLKAMKLAVFSQRPLLEVDPQQYLSRRRSRSAIIVAIARE